MNTRKQKTSSRIVPLPDRKYRLADFRIKLPASIFNEDIYRFMQISAGTFHKIINTKRDDKYEAGYHELRRFVEFYNQHMPDKITMEDLLITEPAIA